MEKLNLLWTTGEKEVVNTMLSPYTQNAKRNGWFDAINILIWGGSKKLIGEDANTQKLVKKMLDNGITVEACKWCADKYKATETLNELGVEVKYMGKGLTNYLKSDDTFMTV